MKKILIALAAIIVAGILWYAVSPLFMNSALDEALPGQEAGTLAPETKLDMPVGEAGGTEETKLSPAIQIKDTPAHPASGTVRIVTAKDKQFLRYENFKTINGPDLLVYLATDEKATEYIDLGRLKATEGNINYEIPAGTDLEKYRYALVWCEDFSVLFNSAQLKQ